MPKTVQEIIAEHQRRGPEILVGYQNKIREITEDTDIDDPFAARVSPEERFRILSEMKAERATALYERTVEAYDAELRRFHDALAVRKLFLEERLFAVDGSEGATALAQAASATNDQLMQMLDLAILAGNDELARTVFVVAHQRQLGDLLARCVEEFDDETRELYREWQEVPDASTLDRQRHNGARRLIEEPSAQQLAGSPAVSSSGA